MAGIKSTKQYIAPPAIDSALDGAGDGNNNVMINPTPAQKEPAKVVETPDYVPPKSSTTSTNDSAKTNEVGAGGGTTGNTTADATLYASIPAEYKVDNLADAIKYWEDERDKHRPLSKDDLAKLRRRQRAEGIISGVSDAVQSLANLMAVHNYAPNMYDPKEGMSAKTRARWEKEKAERDAKDDKFLNYSLQIAKLKNEAQKQGLEAWKYDQKVKQEAAKWPYVRAELVQKANKALNEADKTYYEALIKKGDLEYQPQEHQDKHNESLTRQDANKGRTVASYASAAASKANAAKANTDAAVEPVTYYDKAKGKVVTVYPKTKDGREILLYELAEDMGIDVEQVAGKDAYGRKQNRDKKINRLAAEVKRWRPATSEISMHN